MAIRAWRLLANGMGGIDWAGLPIVVEMLGIHDPESLIARLQVIRAYKPTENQNEPGITVD
jgi:hypothetical protein